MARPNDTLFEVNYTTNNGSRVTGQLYTAEHISNEFNGIQIERTIYTDGKNLVGEYGERFNVWNISTEKNNKTGHPAVYPIAIAHDHIISWSDEGDTILDCFLGSGTTGVACKISNRNFIGFEISEEYFAIAKDRIEKYDATGYEQEPVNPKQVRIEDII